jgi:[acyl-carrier-protein] S-malonyltransferase
VKTVLIFPGYASQYVGMGKDFYNEYRVVQEYFELASSCLNINFTKLCFASSDMELRKIDNAYTAIFLVGASICAVLKEAGINFDMVAGYDHGEYTALFAADGINFPDGLYLLHKLSSFYQEVLTNADIHALLVSGVLMQDLAALCASASSNGDGQVSIALHRTKVEHIVAGNMAAVEKLKKMLTKYEHAKVQSTSVELGLHSPVFNTVADQFKMYLEKVDFNDLKVPLLSCSDGAPIEQGAAVKRHVIDHINSPIRWDKIMESLADADLVIEVGPGTQLVGLISAMYPEKKVMTASKCSDIEEIKSFLQNSAV